MAQSEIVGINIFGKVIGLMVCIWLVSESYYAFAFFVLGMLPSILSILIDKGSGRFASKTIFACNFAGILPFLFDIAITPEKSFTAQQLMNSVFTWSFVYGFAAIGGMMIWVVPEVTSILFSLRADIKTTSLLSEQEGLLTEWGEEVKSGKKRVPPDGGDKQQST